MIEMKKKSGNQGFTLIEVIVTLGLMSFIGLGATYFLVYAVEGFMLARANNEVFQKTNIAMERLVRETKNMNELYQISPTSMRFERDGTRFGLALVGSNIRLVRANTIPTNNNTGSVLIDNINSFAITFQNTDGTVWTVPADNSITDLSKITITIQVAIQNTSRTFTIEINPLYNNMVNGPTS